MIRRFAIILSLLAAVPALAQPAPEQPVTLTVNQAELALVGRGLGTLPFNDVAGLMQKLQAQVNAQQPAPQGGMVTVPNPATGPQTVVPK